MTVETTCRSCGGSDLGPVLSLGHTPLANSLLTAETLRQVEPTYPLDVVVCRACSLVQITVTVPPDELFRDYLYFSSFSETMLRHAEALTSRLVTAHGLGADNLVVEIASNDGYLLQYYAQAGVRVLGIEPARNIARVAEERGIPTVSEFFDERLAATLAAQGQRADVIHANNVLAHVADLNGVIAGIKLLLKEGGVAVIEVPYVRDLIEHVEFDTIYHEHLCYFSLTALEHLFHRHGLRTLDVERLAIHGGSLRVVAGAGSVAMPAVRSLLREEQVWGVGNAETYAGFGARVAGLRAALRRQLTDLKAQGKTIAAYGASAKGCTLLHYCGIGKETLDFVVDRSPVKQGHYTPGTHLPIYAPDRLLEAMPDYVLLLTWNFADEILTQQAAYRARGGRFVAPVPQVRIL